MKVPLPGSKLADVFFSAIFIVLMVSACGGGITGTGGDTSGPAPGDGSNRVTEPLIAPGPSGTPGSGPDSTIEFLPNDVQVAELLKSLDSVAENLASKSVEIPESSITQLLSNKLNAYSQVTSGIQNDIRLLHNVMYQNLRDCDVEGVCEFPTSVSVMYEDSSEVFTYDAIQLDTEITGYFDKRLQYRADNNESVKIQWTNGYQMVSLYSDDQNSITYALLEKSPLRVTYRQIRKSDATMTQISIMEEPTNNTIKIEADLSDWYLKVKVKNFSTVLYALSDDEHITRREAMVIGDRVFLAETCFTVDCVWLPEHPHDNDVFDQVSMWIGRFNATYLETPRDFEFAQPAPRFVIARPSSANASEPEVDSIICGGTTVLTRQRVYCWAPLPLSEDLEYYSEMISGGTIQYSPIQKVD